MLMLLSLLAYHNKPSYRNICFTGIFAALLTMSRIPDIASLAIVMAVIIISQKRLIPILTHSIFGLIVFGVTTSLHYYWIYGNIDNLMTSWSKDNIITGHTHISNFIEGPLTHGPATVRMWLPVIVALLLGYTISRIKTKQHAKYIVFGIIISVLCFFCTYTVTPYPAGYFQFVFIIIAVSGYVYNKTHVDSHKFDNAATWITILLMVIIPAIGSDIIVYRPVVIPAIPVLIAINHKAFMTIPKPAIKIFIISTLIIFIGIKARNLRINHSPIKSDRLEFILTNSSDAPFISNIANKPHSESIAYIGNAKYMNDYLRTDGKGYSLHLFHYTRLTDREIEDDVINKLSCYDTVEIVFFPWGNYENTNYAAIYRHYLIKHGFNPLSEANDNAVFVRQK